MKAYKVYDSDSCENSSTIVFAENSQKARLVAMNTDCCEDAEYINIRAVRVPEADRLYAGKTEVDWYDMPTRIELVKNLGWACWEPSFECDTCAAKPYCRHFEEDTE